MLIPNELLHMCTSTAVGRRQCSGALFLQLQWPHRFLIKICALLGECTLSCACGFVFAEVSSCGEECHLCYTRSISANLKLGLKMLRF